jgi:integrase
MRVLPCGDRLVVMQEYQEFVQFLRERSDVELREKTIRSYLTNLQAMRKKYGLKLDQMDNASHVRGVIKRMPDLSVATVNYRKRIIRLWLEFKDLEVTDEVDRILKCKQEVSKRKLHPKDLLTISDIEDIVQHTETPALRAFFWCVYDSGSRPSALCDLNLEDIHQDRHGYVFNLKKTKTEQSRRPIRLLMPQSVQFLDQWLSVHPDRANPKAPLFINRQGSRFRAQSVTLYLKRFHERRLGKNLNLYLFRKTRATSLLKERRFSELEVKMRLGHKKHSRMMEKYYAILDEDDQAAAELRYLGLQTEAKETPQPVSCPNCGSLNDATASRCQRCRMPLTEEEMTRELKMREERYQDLEQRFVALKKDQMELREFLQQLQKQDRES